MKLKDLFNTNKNSNNNQIVCTIKKKALQKYGLTAEELMTFKINKSKRKVKW